MKISDLKDNVGSRKSAKCLGRGIGCSKGKTCGRGGKGQTARTGVAIKGFEGGQTPIHRRLPKRGFKKINRQIIQIINLGQIQSSIDEEKLPGSGLISKEDLFRVGLISSSKMPVKLLCKGVIESKISIQVDFCSVSARNALASVGSNVILEN